MKNETIKRKCRAQGFKVTDAPDGKRLLINDTTIIDNSTAHFTIVNDIVIVQLDDFIQLLKDAQ